MTRRLLGLCLVAAVALGVGACGRRGAPVAPERRLPLPVAALDAVVHPAAVELAWTVPSKRVDGTPLRDLTMVRVFRTEDDGAGEPRPALARGATVHGYTEIARIRMASPAPAVLTGDRVTLVDTAGLARGRRYTYVVLGEDSRGRASAPSPRRTARFLAPPAVPARLTAAPGDREVRLEWPPSTQLVDGTPAPPGVQYEVLRTADPDGALAPLGAPFPVTRIVDRKVENERAYEYAVRAVWLDGTTRMVGESSPRVRATPVDSTPPSPPGDLVAIPSRGTVRLNWTPSPEPDVASYVVYRAAPRGGFERVGAVAPPGTTFVDRDVPEGPWRYAVTAVDTSSRRNESGRSNEAAVSVP